MEPQMLSIIIPTLNEQENIDRTIESIRTATLLPSGKYIPVEIIVVDGGSEDLTVSIAKQKVDLVLSSSSGRSLQLNTGAAQAKGEVLLFLHADTLLSRGCLWELWKSMQNPSILGGGFLKDWTWSSEIQLSIFIQLSNWFWRGLGKWLVFISRVFPGDNAIFVRKTVFKQLGGFRDMWICEDFDFSYRLRSLSLKNLPRKFGFFSRPTYSHHVACLRSPIITSARRFEDYGFYRVWFWWIGVFLRWRFGWSQEKIKKKYRSYDSLPPKRKRTKLFF